MSDRTNRATVLWEVLPVVPLVAILGVVFFAFDGVTLESLQLFQPIKP